MTQRPTIDLACPVPGCEDRRKGEQPLCATHWYRVPRALRLALWDAGTGSPAYQAALDAVVAAAVETPGLR
jgi:hypothetical protein